MPKKVLIIEDYPATSEMMANILEAEGFAAVIAPDGPSGIEKAHSENPDLILLDIMMPEMSGYEVCERLKGDPSTANIPIIIVSVRATDNNVKKGKDLGAVEYIPKPFDPFKLIDMVKEHLA
jgi:two-component system, OmpR family, alkaline phosphatase synthesis response regulator PhoP